MSVLGEINSGLWDYTEVQLDLNGMLGVAKEFASGEYTQGHEFTQTELVAIASEPLFVEWLRFEYQITSLSETLLEAYLHHADELPPSTQRRLEQLLKTQHYTLWRVGEVVPGNLEMIDLKRGVHTRVREFNMAKQAQPGDCSFLRLARQDDHWEIVSADTFPINVPDLAAAEKLAQGLAEPVSIKQSFGYMETMKRVLGVEPPSTSQVTTLQEARQALDEVLESSGLAVYVKRQRVEELMEAEAMSEETHTTGLPQAIRLLVGLADGEAYLDEVLRAASNLWNALQPAKAGHPSVGPRSAMEPVAILPWQEPFEEAQVAMTTNNAPQAVEAWQEVFRSMRESSSTSRSLYRLYANAGTAYLLNGDMLVGERLLDIALELCPSYDFAQEQKDRIARGEYASVVMKRIHDRISEGGLNLPPSSAELHGWSDTRLHDRIAELGLGMVKTDLLEATSFSREVDEFLEHVWGLNGDDHRIDEAHFLAVEAQRRWSPDNPWPETLEQISADLHEALFPEVPGERRSLQRAMKLARELKQAIQAATDGCIKHWVHGNYGYMDARVEIVEAGLELVRSRDDMEETVSELLRRLNTRSSDPIFLVPAALALADKGKPIKSLVSKIAGALPEDETALVTLAQYLPKSARQEEEPILMEALKNVERREKKGHKTLPPYSRSSLQDSYSWVLDALCTYYEDTDQLGKLQPYQQRYLEVVDDPRLAETETPDEREQRKVSAGQIIDQKLFKDDPAISYYAWFKTLGIDLSSGDGQKTHTTSFGEDGKARKVGRNDPCPCGATKPDGSSVKFKKCHGA